MGGRIAFRPPRRVRHVQPVAAAAEVVVVAHRAGLPVGLGSLTVILEPGRGGLVRLRTHAEGLGVALGAGARRLGSRCSAVACETLRHQHEGLLRVGWWVSGRAVARDARLVAPHVLGVIHRQPRR